MTTIEQAPPRVVPHLPAVDYPADRSVLPTGRFLWRPTQIESTPAEPSPRLAGRRVALLGGSAASAEVVEAALSAAGAQVFRLAPPVDGAETDAAAFVRSAGRLDGIVDLNLEASMDISRRFAWEPAFLQTVGVLKEIFPDWNAETDGERLFYLAVTRMDGRHGFGGGTIGQPLGGLWAGLAKSLPREFDNVNVRVVDLPSGGPDVAPLDAAAAGLICRELYRWGYFEIGHADGKRHTLVADRVDVPMPRIEIDAGDVIVMSGGGRGIGFALAQALCRAHGCTVIISGRAAAPDPSNALNKLSDEDFRAYRDRRLIDAAGTGTLPEVRAKLSRARWDRELWQRLEAAKAEGLDIVYRQCDVADPEQVRALLDSAGPRLIGVVHNAGVDTPVRLPAKKTENIRRTVSVKVVGLMNLLAALDETKPLRFFNIAGSLAGRWGGMVGQLEYGAANDALARIGLWAAADGPQPGRSLRVPVTTMCWPTWERLGIITNFEATLAYMSAINVEEGLYHWHREILAGESGERTFVGEFGKALLPTLLRGYPPSAQLSAVDGLVNRVLFLGLPLKFASGKLIESALEIDPGMVPCCTDFRVGGAPAVPVSMVLEYLRSLGDWVQPEGQEKPITALRDVVVDLAALRLDRIPVRWHAHATGGWTEDKRWAVRATLTREDGVFIAAATLWYGAEPGAQQQVSVPEPDASVAAGTPQWAGQAFRLGRWTVEAGGGRWFADVTADRMADLVAITPTPRPELPLNQLETLVRGVWMRQAPARARRLCVPSIDVPAPNSGSAGVVLADGADWIARTPDGGPRIILRRPYFTEDA